MAALSVTKPRRNENSTAAPSDSPTRSAARIVTRLRLIPGHSASVCATPMISAWRMVIELTDVVVTRSRSPIAANTKIAAEPTIHAAATGPGVQQVVLDRVAEQLADDGRGHERHDERTEARPALHAAADEALDHRPEPSSVQPEHGEDGADLDHHGVGVGRRLVGSLADPHEALGHEEVTRRRDRQVLGEALHRAQHDRLRGGQRVVRGSGARLDAFDSSRPSSPTRATSAAAASNGHRQQHDPEHDHDRPSSQHGRERYRLAGRCLGFDCVTQLESTLPVRYYTDPSYWDTERREIFAKEWQCVGFEYQVERPGDCLTEVVANWPIFVQRGSDRGAPGLPQRVPAPRRSDRGRRQSRRRPTSSAATTAGPSTRRARCATPATSAPTSPPTCA